MEVVDNNKVILFLGWDKETEILVECLVQKGNKCFAVTNEVNNVHRFGAVKVDEDFIFSRNVELDYVVRSRSVDPFNPNVILTRDVCLVYNMVTFFFEFFGYRPVFVIGSDSIIKPLHSLISMSGKSSAKWINNDSFHEILERKPEKQTLVIVAINREDLMDMALIPELILINQTFEKDNGNQVLGYLNTTLLMVKATKRKVKIIGEECEKLRKLKSCFQKNICLTSTNKHDVDCFMSKAHLRANRDATEGANKVLHRHDFSRKLLAPVSDKQLIKLFAVSLVLKLWL